MEVQIAVSKVRKYATSNSGDTVEAIERPQGGYSVVLVDGQSSGRGAKTSSVMVVRKVISLLADGVRDGAAARAASDTLYAEKGGKVSATLNIVSADLHTRTVLVTRNNPNPAYLALGDQIRPLNEESKPIGLYRDTRPVITEVNLQPGLTVVAFTDGLVHAGSRTGECLNIPETLQDLLEEEEPAAQFLADTLLEQAVRLDQQRPVDDISVVVMRIMSRQGDDVRRMAVRLPVDL